MNKFTFNFYNNNEVSNTNNNAKTNERPASPKQYSYYLDLCKQKRVNPEVIGNFSFETMSAEIQRLLSYNPASESQIKLIGEKIDNITQLLSVLNFTEEQIEKFENDSENVISIILAGILRNNLDITQIMSELTGGREGTASKLIEGLIGVEKHFNDIQPPSDNQLELLTAMFFCPDVEFESYGISRKIELEDGMWRKPTPQEFAQSLRDNLTYSDASEFLNKHRGVFHEWKNSRIRPEQLRHIMRLESYMGNDNTPNVVELATTLEGDVIEMGTHDKEYVKGAAFVAHTEEQLIQFSIEEASKYIDQLQAELDRMNETTFIEDTVDYMELRGTHSIEESIDREYQEFNDLIYRLEAIAGYRNEDAHQAATIHLIQNDSPEANVENRKIIRSFMQELLREGAITLNGIIELTQSCPTAQKILLDL